MEARLNDMFQKFTDSISIHMGDNVFIDYYEGDDLYDEDDEEENEGKNKIYRFSDNVIVEWNNKGVKNKFPKYILPILEKNPELQEFVYFDEYDRYSVTHFTTDGLYEITEPQKYFPFLNLKGQQIIAAKCDEEGYAIEWRHDEHTRTYKGEHILELFDRAYAKENESDEVYRKVFNELPENNFEHFRTVHNILKRHFQQQNSRSS